MNTTPPMRLPIPNDEEVEQFKVLYREEFGTELSDLDAAIQCTALVQLKYLIDRNQPKLPEDNSESHTKTSSP